LGDNGKPRVAIIDYEMGNLFSVDHACKYVGLEPYMASDASRIMESDAVILPGVGAFGDAMRNLEKLDLVEPIKDFINSGKPFMGICLGMQLLMSESEEFGRFNGFDIIKGNVVRFLSRGTCGNRVKVPHVGWNNIYYPCEEKMDTWRTTCLADIKAGEYMYFVHSFYVVPSDGLVILSLTEYEGTEFCSGLLYGNVVAFQFHPEKSSKEGIKIYRNWAESVKRSREEKPA
jgi:glutamine amidotransferase